MNVTAQVIDQHVEGVLKRRASDLTAIRPDADRVALKSLAFVFLVAKKAFRLSDEEALDGIVDRPGDFGVDALFFDSSDPGEIRIRLIQGKYRRKLTGEAAFPESGIRALTRAVAVLFDPARRVTVNSRLEARLEEVRSFIAEGAIPMVEAVAANNGRVWTHEAGHLISAAERSFGRQVAWRHIGVDELFRLSLPSRPVRETLRLSGLATVEDFEFRRALIGRMPVSELVRLMDEHGDRVLERNIRGYLGLAANEVNESIARTLRRPADRPSFYFLNNGITMICSQFRHNALQERDWRVQVEDLQIVNGGQTARTAERVARDLSAPDLDEAQVLVRLYETDQGNGDVVSRITLATNSQNPVVLRDLRANDVRQKKLAASIAHLGYEYRAKKRVGGRSPGVLTSPVVAEAVLAVWRRRPHQARFHRTQHFGRLYSIIFSEDLNGAQAILAVLAFRAAENRRKHPPAGGPDFLPYGSRFSAMLLGQYLREETGLGLEALDHRTFGDAKATLQAHALEWLERSESEIGTVLNRYFSGRKRTLQRLSAVFRRADLVEELAPGS